MSSSQDIAYSKYLNNINLDLQRYFLYSAPLLGLVLSTFGLLALVLQKRRESNLLIYIFAWQYAIGIIYPINMVLDDSQYTTKVFGYTLKQYVSDPICKLNATFVRFLYCISPWMQVVIFIYVKSYNLNLLYNPSDSIKLSVWQTKLIKHWNLYKIKNQ
jgi:hypothetical protein